MSNKLNHLTDLVFYANQNPVGLAKILENLVTDVVTKVEITNRITEIESDETTGATLTMTGAVYSQYVDLMTDTITYTLKSAVTGVSILNDVVTIANTVVDSTTFTIVAAVGNIKDEKTFTVVIPADEEEEE